MRRSLSVLALAATLGLSHGADAQSLAAEIRVLLETNPRIAAAQRNADAARDGERKAWGAFLPTLSVEAASGPDRIDSPTRRSQGNDASRYRKDGVSLSIVQNVFDGYRRPEQYNSARTQTAIQDSTFEATRQTVLFEAVATYLDVLRTSQLLDMSRRNEQTIQRQLNLESERVQRGGGMAVDALFARSRLQLGK
ncbi:MAG: TolC family protein, partial [Alphaproteobacteria bacterium]